MKLPRLLLIAMGMVALISAMWGGLVRLGWPLPIGPSGATAFHGPLMVCGFLGTVIGLERAVALRAGTSYLVPLVTGLGGIALIVGAPGPLGALLITLGGVGLVAIFAVMLRRQHEMSMTTMALGALAWLVGNALWLAGWPIHRAVPWWIGFLVLTIAGERLDLARFVRVSTGSRRAFMAIVLALVLGLVLSSVRTVPGMRITGAAMAAAAVWLGRHDIARHTVKQRGLPRFTAVCLLSGYVWLGLAGLVALAAPGAVAGFVYDAMLHGVFLGFVMAMIFGHAPIIFPAVLGRPMPFRPRFYAHLALLHASLVLRVGGDLTGWLPGRHWGGLLNAVAVLLFLVNTVAALAQGSSDRQSHPGLRPQTKMCRRPATMGP